MSKSLVVYFSQGGTTARVAEAIAAGLRAARWEVDLWNLRDGPPPDARAYELIGIGSPVYFYRPPFNVTDYVQSLPDLQGRASFVFVLHGTYRGDTGTMLRDALAGKGAREAGYLHCRGADYFLGYLKEGVLFSPDHPTADELARAEAFGRQVAAHVAGRPYARPTEDRPPALIYRVERFATNHWLARQVFSRLFTVDARCTACGRCMDLCPTGNITADGEGRPAWGRDCLLCLTCEMKCPQEAITSPASWPLFRPAMVYNVRHALRDPALDHARVVHSRGRTRPAGGAGDLQED
jgi:flavodoxin/Pyruvate/2-oxoacid:ferredoxin oxidoreductase delta subunit